jgi:hypothetical protein
VSSSADHLERAVRCARRDATEFDERERILRCRDALRNRAQLPGTGDASAAQAARWAILHRAVGGEQIARDETLTLPGAAAGRSGRVRIRQSCLAGFLQHQLTASDSERSTSLSLRDPGIEGRRRSPGAVGAGVPRRSTSAVRPRLQAASPRRAPRTSTPIHRRRYQSLAAKSPPSVVDHHGIRLADTDAREFVPAIAWEWGGCSEGRSPVRELTSVRQHAAILICVPRSQRGRARVAAVVAIELRG